MLAAVDDNVGHPILRGVYGTIDLGFAGLLVDHSASSLAGIDNPLISYIELMDMVRSGCRGSEAYDWLGRGVTSSVINASNTQVFGYGALGLIINYDSFSPTDPTDMPFASSPWTALGQTFVSATYIGDANLDGLVNFVDYGFIDAGIGHFGTGWGFGDFNLDGVVDFIDYGFIDAGVAAYGAFGVFAYGF